MSLIPSNAISSALTPVQRDTHEPLRARNVQTQKNSHHSEDVGELEDTAVGSVRDQRQNSGRKKDTPERDRGPDEPEENVEITALNDTPQKVLHAPPTTASLDISA